MNNNNNNNNGQNITKWNVCCTENWMQKNIYSNRKKKKRYFFGTWLSNRNHSFRCCCSFLPRSLYTLFRFHFVWSFMCTDFNVRPAPPPHSCIQIYTRVGGGERAMYWCSLELRVWVWMWMCHRIRTEFNIFHCVQITGNGIYEIKVFLVSFLVFSTVFSSLLFRSLRFFDVVLFNLESLLRCTHTHVARRRYCRRRRHRWW